MLELVSTDDARAHLRLDDTQDDSWLSVFIPAISSAVAMWLKDEWRLYVPEYDADGNVITDSNDDPIPSSDSNGYVIQPLVRAAVLVELASQYTSREGDTKNDMTAGVRFNDGRGYGYILNKTSTALLSALRKPTLD